MSDPVADAAKAEEGKEVVKEEVAEEKPAVSNADVVNAIKEVKDALSKPGQPAPTRQQIREALKDKTGFSDAQLDVVEQMQASAVSHNSKKVAELEAKVVWNDFEKEMGGKIDPGVEKLMKEELKGYDIQAHGDKVLLQKIYYMTLGMQADKAAKQRKADPNANDKPNDNANIERRTIVESNKGSVTGLNATEKKPSSGSEQLSDDEKTVASKMGISADDYARAKGTKVVSRLKGAAQ